MLFPARGDSDSNGNSNRDSDRNGNRDKGNGMWCMCSHKGRRAREERGRRGRGQAEGLVRARSEPKGAASTRAQERASTLHSFGPLTLRREPGKLRICTRDAGRGVGDVHRTTTARPHGSHGNACCCPSSALVARDGCCAAATCTSTSRRLPGPRPKKADQGPTHSSINSYSNSKGA